MASGADATELRAIVGEAAAGQRTLGLSLDYRRGHEMAGTTELSVRDGIRYSVRAENARRQFSYEASGELTSDEAAALWSAVADHLFDVPSSTRPLGDGEVPTSVTVEADGLRHAVKVWARDGRSLDPFLALLRAIGTLLSGLTGSAVSQ